MDDTARYHRAKRCEKTWDGSTVFDPNHPIAVQCYDCGATWFDGRPGYVRGDGAFNAIQVPVCAHIPAEVRRFMAVTNG